MDKQEIDHLIFASGGNDSVALIQWCIEKGVRNLAVVYNDTGWAASFWAERVWNVAKWCADQGIPFYITQSEGMSDLVRRKKGFPAGGRLFQFCTTELKIKPSQEFLDLIDPDKEITCLTGVRRAESRERSTAPEWITESDRHGGRELWQPLVRHDDLERNRLIKKAGFEILPHRSAECFPCINANIKDIRALDENSIVRLESLEIEMGYTRNDKPRVMFRPKRHTGSIGIREVKVWADKLRSSELKKIERDKQFDLFDVGSGSGCDSGFCGG